MRQIYLVLFVFLNMVSPEWKWVGPYFSIFMLNCIAGSVVFSIIGPAQPFIAKNVGLEVDSINFIWTVAYFSSLSGSIISSVTFKQYITKSYWKIIIITIGITIHSSTTFFIPYVTSFLALSLLMMVREVCGGYSGTGSSGLLVYTLGPIRTRIMVMIQHFSVGVGFLIGPLLIAKYFNLDSNKHAHDVCPQENLNVTLKEPDLADTTDDEVDIETPFTEVGWFQVTASLIYLAMLCLPYEMPVHESFRQEKASKKPELPKISSPRELFTMFLILLFYTSSCGSERTFQSMQFTFGMCGPLKLSPSQALVTDKFYNGGFMTGRFLSIFVVYFIQPKYLLRTSLVLCLIVASVILMVADQSANILFLCAGVFGMSVSWQFGSMYSWCAEHMDVVGGRASLFAVGCALGGMLAPPIGGYLFRRVHPMAVWYLNFTFVIIQWSTTVILTYIFAKSDTKEQKTTQVVYERVPMDEMTLMDDVDLSDSS